MNIGVFEMPCAAMMELEAICEKHIERPGIRRSTPSERDEEAPRGRTGLHNFGALS